LHMLAFLSGAERTAEGFSELTADNPDRSLHLYDLNPGLSYPRSVPGLAPWEKGL
jgi:hypothetical protein